MFLSLHHWSQNVDNLLTVCITLIIFLLLWVLIGLSSKETSEEKDRRLRQEKQRIEQAVLQFIVAESTIDTIIEKFFATLVTERGKQVTEALAPLVADMLLEQK